jgi:hypothetical protein
MKVIVEFPDDHWDEIKCNGINRQTVAAHLRSELSASRGLHPIDSWQNMVFDDINVYALTDRQNSEVSKALKESFRKTSDKS